MFEFDIKLFRIQQLSIIIHIWLFIFCKMNPLSKFRVFKIQTGLYWLAEVIFLGEMTRHFPVLAISENGFLRKTMTTEVISSEGQTERQTPHFSLLFLASQIDPRSIHQSRSAGPKMNINSTCLTATQEIWAQKF